MPEARSRAHFELLRFTAAPVSADVAVVELEGRFARDGRFSRAPVLVVEDSDDDTRVQLAPVSSTLAGGRWRGTYAVPISSLTAGSFALGLRGTLLDLGDPDVEDGGDRFAALARETNALRRRLDRAEAEAAEAREEAEAARAGTEAAVTAAREAAAAEAAERLEVVQREAGEARDAAEAAKREAEADVARRVQEAEAGAARRTEQLDADATRRVLEADARAADAEERATALQVHVDTARAELDDERVRAQNALAEVQQALEAARAEERDLRKQLRTTRAATEAKRREAARPHRPGDQAGDRTVEETQPLTAIEAEDQDDDAAAVDETRPMPTLDDSQPPPEADDDDHRTTATESVRFIGRHPRGEEPLPFIPPTVAPVRRDTSAGRWIAVGALLLFAFVLLGLVFGFLG